MNYHAFQQYCMMQDGLPLFPRHQHGSIDLECMLILPDAATYQETLYAYQRFVNDYGPDDFFSLKYVIEDNMSSLNIRQIMAVLRFSGYDALLFSRLLPQLYEILDNITDNERTTLFYSINRIWDTYFPLSEPYDLAFELGGFLFELGFYEESINFLHRSGKIYGQSNDILFNQALCYQMLGDNEKIKTLLQQVLETDPAHTDALKMLKAYSI